MKGSNNRGMALFMALCLLVVMGGLASIFVLNITYTLSFFHKQLKSQTAFNLAEAGIESAIWNLSRPKSEYQGEKDTGLGEGTFTVTVEKSETGAGHVKVISRGFYPDSVNPKSECTLMAILDAGKDIKILLWKQVPK